MTTVATDSFTRADSAVALGNSDGPGSLAWTSLFDTWGISSNQAYNSGALNGATAALDVGTPTQSVSADVTCNGGNCYLTARATDSSNLYLAGLNTGALYALYKEVGAGFTLLASSSTTDTSATLTLSANGTAIALAVNGAPLLSVTDGAITTGNKAGLWNGKAGSASRWDNFLVASVSSSLVTTGNVRLNSS